MNPLATGVTLKLVEMLGNNLISNNKNQNDNNQKETIKQINELKDKIEKMRKENKIINNKYSNYAPDLENINTGCLVCSRAHIVGIKGALKEALRFAREDGIKHPEVIKRIDNAIEELIVMERFDLTPEEITKLNKEEKELIDNALIKIRKLRQILLNKIDDMEDLNNAIILANEIYEIIRKQQENN